MKKYGQEQEEITRIKKQNQNFLKHYQGSNDVGFAMLIAYLTPYDVTFF